MEIGVSQQCRPAPKWVTILEAIITITAVLILLFITPMPEKYIPSELKVYLLSVSGGASIALSKLKEYTGQTEKGES